jgi:hypothetical protein
MSLIIGQDNFGETVRQQLNFIDKSLFIKEIFDNKEIAVSVIVRPRRFGKTFNMSMLHHFLAAEVNGLKTKNMFDDLKIAQVGETYMKHQGQYPVVFISFKNVKHSNYASTYNGMAKLMSQTYSEHLELLSSQKLNHHQKEIFLSVIEERATQASLQSSLFDLTHALYLHYGVKPWVLIDEYDTPTQAGYLENYYKEIIELMRGLLGSVLKSNANIHRAVITGILRIAKENLFSGLNNVQVFSVLDKEYSEHFGFTEPEVDEALEKNNLYHLSTDIKAWYNGYHIGNTQIYNPWSIANCIFEKGMLQPYWLNTSDNTLIKQTIAHANGLLKIECEKILEGKPVEALVDENITFADLNGSGDKLWTLLLFSGYLTSIHTELAGFEKKCLLQPPNKEIALLYSHVINAWFKESLGQENYHYLLKSLITGDVQEFLEILQKFLFESLSYFDVKGNAPEKFYHGFVMGLIVSLSGTHHIQSNKESGRGRYDVLIIPKDLTQLGIIIEFKVAKEGMDLQTAADEALEQINQRGYATELSQKHIKKILKMGLAFYGKDVALASQS